MNGTRSALIFSKQRFSSQMCLSNKKEFTAGRDCCCSLQLKDATGKFWPPRIARHAHDNYLCASKVYMHIMISGLCSSRGYCPAFPYHAQHMPVDRSFSRTLHLLLYSFEAELVTPYFICVWRGCCTFLAGLTSPLLKKFTMHWTEQAPTILIILREQVCLCLKFWSSRIQIGWCYLQCIPP